MPRRLAQQRMTLSDLEWSFHALRTVSAVAELQDCYYSENSIHCHTHPGSVLRRVMSRHISLTKQRAAA